MPRRNNRERYEPLDCTPPELEEAAPSTPSRQARRKSRFNESDFQRARRQAEARVNGAIDWSVCIVPGCGRSLVMYGTLTHWEPAHRDSTLELPICHPHAAVVWNGLVEFHAKRGEFAEAIADVNERVAARSAGEATERKERHLSRTDGEIYYLRLNGLIKVGWSRCFYDRLKAYGPDVEVLAHYEGTRSDETNLHRQLRPALAKGREWYHDCDIVQAFVKEAIENHGPPTLTSYDWTVPVKVVAGKRLRGKLG